MCLWGLPALRIRLLWGANLDRGRVDLSTGSLVRKHEAIEAWHAGDGYVPFSGPQLDVRNPAIELGGHREGLDTSLPVDTAEHKTSLGCAVSVGFYPRAKTDDLESQVLSR